MAQSGKRNKQEKQLFHKLRFVMPACLAVGVAASIGFVLTRHWVWFTLCLLLFATQIGLVIAMPDYFTFEIPKYAKKKRVHELWAPITAMMILLLLSFRINWLDDWMMLICAIIGIAVAAVIFLVNPDLRSRESAILCVVIFGALGGWFVIGTGNEVYDYTEQVSYVLEVEALDKEGGKYRSWYCCVTLPDGREEWIGISGGLYNDLEVGDLVRVEVGEGFFGIEYANIYAIEEGE